MRKWRREKNPWRRHNYSGLSSSFINLSCLEGLYKSQHEKIVCQHYTVYLTGTHLTTTSASLQIKLSQKSKSILFYLDSISVKHLNNLLSPIPVSSAPFKDFAKNEIFFFWNKISTQKVPQNLKTVHYTPTLSEDIPPSEPTKKILAFLECLKMNGRISAVRCYHCN